MKEARMFLVSHMFKMKQIFTLHSLLKMQAKQPSNPDPWLLLSGLKS
jgi:hypothetical protein